MIRRQRLVWGLRLAAARYRFKESPALFPALMMVAGILLALGTTAIDKALGPAADLPLTLSMSSQSAMWLLSTVAGAMMTTAGVVFSLTVVSLQLASEQFSPRVMRSFIRDRVSQGVIGLLVATFFYCVLILPSLSGEATDPAPPLSPTVALILTLVTVLGIIVHLDHLSRGLQVGNLARVISTEGQNLAVGFDTVPAGLRQIAEKASHAPRDAAVVRSETSGWVSQVDRAQALRAVPANTTVRLESRVGAYIHKGEVIFSIWPPPPAGCQERLAKTMEVADARTMLQDVDFAIRQLVDIGLRALSPAVNDPTTAVEIILRLGSLLRTLLTTSLAPATLGDSAGRVFMQPWNLDHQEYIEHAFEQLRQSCLTQPPVAAALLRVLRMLMEHVQEQGHPEHVGPLRRQVQLLTESLHCQSGLHPEDLRYLALLTSDETDPADHSH